MVVTRTQLLKKKKAGMTTKEDEEELNRIQQAQTAAGEQFIGERERRASQLQAAGSSPTGAQRRATAEITNTTSLTLPEQEGITRTTEEVQAEKQRREGILGEGRVTGEEPEQKSLKPKLSKGEEMGILGAGAFQGARTALAFDEGLKPNREKLLQSAQELPEEQRAAFIEGEIQRQAEELVIKQNLKMRERMGILIESIPIIPKVARRFGVQLSTPTDKVNDLVKNIEGIDIEFQSKNAEINPVLALVNLNSIEDEIAVFESRIQNTIIVSPELRSNPEEVINIEQKILSKRQEIFLAREKIKGLILPTTI